MAKKVKVSVGIVTYSSSKDIEKCLSSLIAYCPENVYLDVWVFDNKSPDSSETQEIVKKQFPMVHLLVCEKNLGFGYGHNVIIENIVSDFHIILNADIEFEQDVLTELLSYLTRNPDTVLVTPEIRNIDGTIQHLPKRYPKIKYVLSSTIALFARYRDDYTRANDNLISPTEIDISTGCLMLVHTDRLKEVGGFDDGFFLYFEDFDLSMRLRKIGKLFYYPQVHVQHLWHRDSKRSKRLFMIQLKSMFRFYRKWTINRLLENVK